MMGVIAGLNLAYLHPNPSYPFGWWKVLLAAVIAVVFSTHIRLKRGSEE